MSHGALASARSAMPVPPSLQDCSIELTIGRRYGLIGQNGSGKSNFLKCIAKREVRKIRACTPPDLKSDMHGNGS